MVRAQMATPAGNCRFSQRGRWCCRRVPPRGLSGMHARRQLLRARSYLLRAHHKCLRIIESLLKCAPTVPVITF
eukprot:6802687-Pyramimonas_sp.AAC.1